MDVLLILIEIEIGWRLLAAILFVAMLVAVAFGVPRDR